MRATVLLMMLVLGGCTENHAELESAQAILDRQLAYSQASADQLNELRREVDELEAQVNALATTPESQAMLKAARAKAHPEPKRAPFIPPTLPSERPFEGSRGKQLRRMIADTEARIAMLEKVLEEVDRLRARRDQAKGDLALLKP